ncbi:MAG: DUF6541 family protein [Chloroflexia bacterium]
MTIDTNSPLFYLHLFIALLALTLPGAAIYLGILAVWGKNERKSELELLIAAPALSTAFWPLLLLFTTLLGFSFSPLVVWSILGLAGIATALFAWRLFRPPTRADEGEVGTMRMRSPGALPIAVTLLALTVLSLAYRLSDIQGLTVPMFGDSLHHTLITQIIIEGGRVPSGYAPYVPVDTFTYHFGFHTLAAVIAWLTGATAPYSVLLVGQLLNTACVPLAYLLNRTLFGTRLAGLGAALATGFISIMPSYYVNWGRYTQLAGQALLIGALVFLSRLLSSNWKRSDLALTAFCVAGLVVVHYRVLIFFGLFALAFGARQLIAQRHDFAEVLRSWGRGFAAVFLGLLVALLWLLNLAENYFRGLVVRLSTVTPEYLQDYNNIESLEKFVGRFLPALSLAGVIAALFQIAIKWRSRESRSDSGSVRNLTTFNPQIACLTMALWAALLVLSLWVIPGAIGSYTVAISLYIPLAALAGYAIASAAGQIIKRFKLSPAVLAAAIFVASGASSTMFGTAHVIDQGSFGYVHPPDLKAFKWVRANTPPNSTFLISSQFSYVGRGVTASDAGMWIPLLTGRGVSLPALSTWMERPVEVGYFEKARLLAAYTQPLDDPTQVDDSTQQRLVGLGILETTEPITSTRTLKAMQQKGITHIYSGAPEGHSTPRLDINTIRKDTQHFRLVYDQEGVLIFEVGYGQITTP